MDILTELKALEPIRQALKRRAMIYDVEAKEKLAAEHGKPIDTYYHLDYESWIELQN